MKRIGADVGGIFTGLTLVDEESGRVTVDKVASMTDDPAKHVINGVRAIRGKATIALSDVDNVLHGTTVGTNTVLTHDGQTSE